MLLSAPIEHMNSEMLVPPPCLYYVIYVILKVKILEYGTWNCINPEHRPMLKDALNSRKIYTSPRHTDLAYTTTIAWPS